MLILFIFIDSMTSCKSVHLHQYYFFLKFYIN